MALRWIATVERVAIGQALEAELGERRGGDKKSNAKNLDIDPSISGQRTDTIAAEKSGFGNPETYRQVLEAELGERRGRPTTTENSQIFGQFPAGKTDTIAAEKACRAIRKILRNAGVGQVLRKIPKYLGKYRATDGQTSSNIWGSYTRPKDIRSSRALVRIRTGPPPTYSPPIRSQFKHPKHQSRPFARMQQWPQADL